MYRWGDRVTERPFLTSYLIIKTTLINRVGLSRHNTGTVRKFFIPYDPLINFDIKIVVGKKYFSGYFSHNGEYENTLTLFTKRKSVTINRVFSPPNDVDLTLQVNEGNISKEKKLKRDDTFFNYFKKIINLLKAKKFETSYRDLLKDSFFRGKLCLKKNIIKI